ncbi:uncharacterized protein LOC107636267 [Arachis ipaensis]|uniref:uncharacterized protein LOC107636267 n=1 Tax=Arachis ipaensis TaxID=130454 RepID=UPI0007AF85A5|nr:uncharacterized protein LOC107636267 [Arachis ipaensis]XP_025647509.1 uncharacterized protein LOC112742485 [Arachis hypogaea]
MEMVQELPRSLEADKPRYRNRKGDITTNVLGVVAPDMQFIYVLAGWVGSTADSRTQGRVITACCLLHNHIRRVMVVDPIDEIVDQNMLGVDGGMIHHIETGDAWGRWRDQFAQEIWN